MGDTLAVIGAVLWLLFFFGSHFLIWLNEEDQRIAVEKYKKEHKDWREVLEEDIEKAYKLDK